MSEYKFNGVVIRHIEENGKVYFRIKDLYEALEYKSSNNQNPVGFLGKSGGKDRLSTKDLGRLFSDIKTSFEDGPVFYIESKEIANQMSKRGKRKLRGVRRILSPALIKWLMDPGDDPIKKEFADKINTLEDHNKKLNDLSICVHGLVLAVKHICEHLGIEPDFKSEDN